MRAIPSCDGDDVVCDRCGREPTSTRMRAPYCDHCMHECTFTRAEVSASSFRAVAARAEAAERRADDLQTQLSAAADRIRELEIRSHAPGVSVIAVDPRGGGVPDLGADPERE